MTQDNLIALKPCPHVWCAAAGVLQTHLVGNSPRPECRAGCDICDVYTPQCRTPEEAARLWNSSSRDDATSRPISSRELMRLCGHDSDGPFEAGPFPSEMRERPPTEAKDVVAKLRNGPRYCTDGDYRALGLRAADLIERLSPPLDGFAPCPTCRQYSHSIGEDRIAEAFMHFQSMFSHRGDGIPTQYAFDEKTRDAAQVLMSAAQSGRAHKGTFK